MMKRLVGLGVVMSILTSSAVSLAQDYWQSESFARNGSFLSDPAYRTARFFDDAPKAADAAADAAEHALPSPSDAAPHGSGLQPQVPSIVPQSSAGSTPSTWDAPGGAGSSAPYGSVLPEQASDCPTCSSGTCVDGSCSIGGGYAGLGGCNCSPWFGGVYGLVMTRNDNFNTYLTYQVGQAFPPLLQTSDANTQYGGGVETVIGRYLNDCWAIQAVYWGFYPSTQTASITATNYPAPLASALGFNGLSYNSGAQTNTVSTWFGTAPTGAQAHCLRRSFQAHNVEVNFIRNPYRRTGCVHYELLAGARYLNLQDGFQFLTDYTNTSFGDDPANELEYRIDIDNHLVGAQIGGRVDYYFWRCFSANLGSKLGIYGNHIRAQQSISGGNGLAYVTGFPNSTYNLDQSGNNVAFVGELFAGLSYDIGNCWRLTGGYRAISACGVATAVSQIPRDRDFASVTRAGQINHNDSLILHGAYFGAEYNW